MTQPTNINNIEKILLSRRLIDEKTNCWLFTGSCSDGYGMLQFNYKLRKVHRLSAMLYMNFDIESDKLILHKNICPNRHCFNPEHIYIGTIQDNTRDSILANTHSSIKIGLVTQCPRGHSYNEENTYTRANGHRSCRICTKENNNRLVREKKERFRSILEMMKK